jgi:hypothetical protein
MSIFKGAKIKHELKTRILNYMDIPDLDSWNKIAHERVTMKYTLWNAVNLINPKYIYQYNGSINQWKTFPDTITLVRAIKEAILKSNEPEDNFFFFKPAA